MFLYSSPVLAPSTATINVALVIVEECSTVDQVNGDYYGHMMMAGETDILSFRPFMLGVLGLRTLSITRYRTDLAYSH
jgi:hypothetical protein